MAANKVTAVHMAGILPLDYESHPCERMALFIVVIAVYRDLSLLGPTIG
jgi:hypothetical protein